MSRDSLVDGADELTPMRAIRKKCLDCSGGSYKEVRLCPVVNCPLWHLRFGKRKTTLSPELFPLLDRSLMRETFNLSADQAEKKIFEMARNKQ
ncbi:hypothetical protein JXA12_04695 [Candidatus Woesearchaeota archaeon]|nr:hypothetical protein [Candidatus Woesearchaeota archaeon]